MRLVFPEVRLTEVRVVWQPPVDPNGIIMGKRKIIANFLLLDTNEIKLKTDFSKIFLSYYYTTV